MVSTIAHTRKKLDVDAGIHHVQERNIYCTLTRSPRLMSMIANVDHYSPFIALHLELFKCSEQDCNGRAFRSRSELRRHNEGSHGLEEALGTSFPCPHEGCPSATRPLKTTWGLEDHLYLLHGRNKSGQHGRRAGIRKRKARAGRIRQSQSGGSQEKARVDVPLDEGFNDQFQFGQIQELPDDTDMGQCHSGESQEEGDEVDKVEGLMRHVQFFPRGPHGEMLSFSG
ncbi:hypothetical protein BKA56DRAFT_234420 [Ilyonectria sp. MPI-CAGE-AT-0026]|nr:hypothetical protein BKA56DRAFT_234420 [Ilyonectria sp. MPI-CAGE-AT-0026]